MIVGTEDGQDDVVNTLHELYSPFMRKSDRFIRMDIKSAELTKYASNAMLATRISFMNSLARLCEKVGANIESIRTGMGTDPRIGSDFLFSGIGYGGSCFPKDLKALIHLGREYGQELPIIEAANGVNETQAIWFFQKIDSYFAGQRGLEGKTVGVWGLAFKANTDDVRESQALKLVEMLLDAGVNVKVFDPEALNNARRQLGDGVVYCEDMYQCATGAHALAVCADWSEFRFPDWKGLENVMQEVVVFDGRNLYSGLNKVGSYQGVGTHKE